MKIALITPAGKGSRSGNRQTANRWARILKELGHNVFTSVDYDGRPAQLMIAIHAWRSAEAISEFKRLYPASPLIVVLSGTDINEFIHTDPEATLKSMEAADQLVALHDGVRSATPRKFRKKLNIIYQSAKPPVEQRAPKRRTFDICVAGHLREVKDPFRAAEAVRDLPHDSKIRVLHFGKHHTPEWAGRARAEMRRNTRYIWRGEVPHWRIRREFARANLMVISSLSEGGANVVSEAVVAGLPVIASRIPGNVGLLGDDYPGYFPVGDTEALRTLLLRAESDRQYVRELTAACRARRHLFTRKAEREAWRRLLTNVAGGS